MNGSATKRAGTSVTSAAEITGLEAPGAAAMRSGDGPAYMAMDHVHGRLASLERCPTALGSMVSMRQDNFNNLPDSRLLECLSSAPLRRVINIFVCRFNSLIPEHRQAMYPADNET